MKVAQIDHGSMKPPENTSGAESAGEHNNIPDETIRSEEIDGDDIEEDIVDEQSRDPVKRGRKKRASFSETAGNLSRVHVVMISGLVLLCGILIFALFKNNQVYTSYEIKNQISRGDDTSVYYKLVTSGIVRYSNNGIALMDKNGTEIWDQTYEMSSPIITVAGSYIAVGDREANSIYIFNEIGQCGKLTTDIPLQSIEISQQGVLAVMLSDTSENYINLYDKSGNILVNIKATLENTGFPEAMDLSSDGTRLAVSYLSVNSGSVQSNFVVYDFSDAGGSDKELYKETLDGLCPQIAFLNESGIVVFKENGCNIYSSGESVSKTEELTFDDSIKSIFQNDENIGFIFDNSDENGKYCMKIYNISGGLRACAYLDMDYSNVSCNEDNIVVCNSTQAVVFKFNGKQIFEGTFSSHITDMIPSWEKNMFWIVANNSMEEIRLR